MWNARVGSTPLVVVFGTARSLASSRRGPYASAVSFFDFVEVDSSPSAWMPEGGNFLILEDPNGVLVHIEGAPTIEQAIELADALNRTTTDVPIPVFRLAPEVPVCATRGVASYRSGIGRSEAVGQCGRGRLAGQFGQRSLDG